MIKKLIGDPEVALEVAFVTPEVAFVTPEKTGLQVTFVTPGHINYEVLE
jgi:hypothetical protein